MNSLTQSTEESKGMEGVKATYKFRMSSKVSKHDIYMIHLAEEEIEQHEVWINELQELHEEAAITHTQYVTDQTLQGHAETSG